MGTLKKISLVFFTFVISISANYAKASDINGEQVIQQVRTVLPTDPVITDNGLHVYPINLVGYSEIVIKSTDIQRLNVPMLLFQGRLNLGWKNKQQKTSTTIQRNGRITHQSTTISGDTSHPEIGSVVMLLTVEQNSANVINVVAIRQSYNTLSSESKNLVRSDISLNF